MRKIAKLAASAIALGLAAPVLASEGMAHHAAVFLGATNHDSHSENTAGVEYEYRLPLAEHLFGLGVVAEQVMVDPDVATIVVAGVVAHPWKGLKGNLMVGRESQAGHSENVFRVGLGYDMHHGSLSYGPVYNMDSIGSTTSHVFGVTLGMGF